jgi:pimeloyl-ACP methyl ester carboxylesterase
VRCVQAAQLPRWARYTPAPAGAPHADVLVLLVGWLGCKREYLDRYEALYAARGLSTLAALPPVSATLSPRLADRATAALLAASPGALQPAQRTLLHVASNGGFLFLSHLLRAARLPGAASPATAAAAAQLTASCRGLLLDCAPAVITADVAVRALAAVARSSAASDAPPPAAAKAVCAAYLRAPPVARRLRELRQAWGGSTDDDDSGGDMTPLPPALAVPTACLYTADDTLVPPGDVERWARQRAASGAPPPTLVRFVGAPHVELLRYHPAAYDASVGEWLAASLAAR